MTGLSRRRFLTAGGGLTLAGALSACGSPIATSLTGGQPATADVIYWHLFGGGDGENMAAMVSMPLAVAGCVVTSSTRSPW